MADSFSVERRRLMRFLGARVVLTPRAAKGFGMYQKARELAEANGWFLARQFETADNARIHENTTARELLADFDGERLDYWVSGYGTGGTVTGVARVLRRERPETRIVLSEPEIAQLLGSGAAQARTADHAPAASHPAFTPHPIQGWTPDFIPHVLQESIDRHYYDELIPVGGPAAIAWSRRLAAEEGIFAGISSGATLAVAIQVAERAPAGSVICCMLPDTGERYLSTPLFEGVASEMTPEEEALIDACRDPKLNSRFQKCALFCSLDAKQLGEQKPWSVAVRSQFSAKDRRARRLLALRRIWGMEDAAPR